MPQIGYADLHCDSVTVCCDKAEKMQANDGQVSFEKLKKAACRAQCFAIFTEGKNAAEDFEKYLAFYYAQINSSADMAAVKNEKDLISALSAGKIAAVLTVENLGFIEGDIGKISTLAAAGVKIASLVWNHPNSLAFPNLIFKGGLPDFAAREGRGLTPLGREAVKELGENRILLDVSHLSDGGVEEALTLSKLPVIATHSNCAECHPVSRNLTDGQIRAIAESGGVVGLNLCRDFLGGDPKESFYRHFNRLMNVGGEDCLAFGSDFDGIPRYSPFNDCTCVQTIFEFLEGKGVSARVLEKFAFTNFKRVLECVL